MLEEIDPIKFLKDEMEKRKKKNPYFSMRAFAKYLEISPAQLSQVLSNKRPMTKKMALKICERLSLSMNDRMKLMRSLHSDTYVDQDEIGERLNLEEEQFKLISDWPHLAILSLPEIGPAKAFPTWVGKRLQICPDRAQSSLARLEKLGIIKVERGKFKQVQRPLSISSKVASAAIRNYHRQNLKLAEEKLETTPLEEREFSAITMAINPENMDKAKELITKFKRQLARLLSEGEKKEVYTLSVQLFPNTVCQQIKKNHKKNSSEGNLK